MRIKLGPVTMEYKGTARLEEVDEGARTAVFSVQGKETRGQGSASASIRNRLVEENGSTRVRVETELSVTGRPAQFGRGIMEDVATRMLSDFASCLSQMMAGEGAAEPAAALGPTASQQPEALALGGALWRVLLGRVTGFLSRLVGRRRPAP